MREIAFRRVVDDVRETDGESLGAKLYLECLVRLVSQAIEKRWIDCRRLFSNQPRERGAFCAMSFACRAEAAEQMDLQCGCLGEFVLRQFDGALIEVICDAHRADRVRA